MSKYKDRITKASRDRNWDWRGNFNFIWIETMDRNGEMVPDQYNALLKFVQRLINGAEYRGRHSK